MVAPAASPARSLVAPSPRAVSFFHRLYSASTAWAESLAACASLGLPHETSTAVC